MSAKASLAMCRSLCKKNSCSGECFDKGWAFAQADSCSAPSASTNNARDEICAKIYGNIIQAALIITDGGDKEAALAILNDAAGLYLRKLTPVA